jgi:hypothetical protein
MTIAMLMKNTLTAAKEAGASSKTAKRRNVVQELQEGSFFQRNALRAPARMRSVFGHEFLDGFLVKFSVVIVPLSEYTGLKRLKR